MAYSQRLRCPSKLCFNRFSFLFSFFFVVPQVAWTFFWSAWVGPITPSITHCSLTESSPLLSSSKHLVSQYKLDWKEGQGILGLYVSSVSKSPQSAAFGLMKTSSFLLFRHVPQAVTTLWMRCLTWLKAWVVYRWPRKTWLCSVLLSCSHQVRFYVFT